MIARQYYSGLVDPRFYEVKVKEEQIIELFGS
jgi:hypothetical protein